MSKINLTDATTLTNETSFVSTLNTNYATIETASDNFLSLDGTSPNSMGADFDMNSYRITNLPTPLGATEPLRLQDLSDFIGNGTISITAGAPITSSYVTLGTNATLTSERVLTAGTGITLTDAGAGSTLTVATTQPVITTSASLAAILSDETGTGSVVFGTSPSLTTPVLTSATVTTKIIPTTNDGAALGQSGTAFADLFLASGAVINWAAGGVQLAHFVDGLTFIGGTSGYYFQDGPVGPAVDDGSALGTTALKWSDLFLASGAVINFNSGDATITHAVNSLSFEGASSGYSFDAPVVCGSSYYKATAPSTQTADFTVTDLHSFIICDKAGTLTITLPSAASSQGRTIYIKTIQAQTVVSASSNVVPNTTATAGTAILPATDGAWCMIVSDGTNWIRMASSTLA